MNPQYDELIIVDQRAQPGHPGTDQRDRVGVGGVGLAALSGGEYPRPGRQLRWNVDHLLAVGEQPGGDVSADALAALDRPDPIWPLLGVLDRRRMAGPVGAEAAAAEDRLVAGHHLDGGRAFMRVHADDHPVRPAHTSSVARSNRFVEPGGQRYFELSKLLSLSRPWATPGTAQAT
jgi:hypothetical protein